MIITIKGADFSGSNIGTLDTYLVSKSIGAGATHDIPNYVTKDAAVSWTITLSEGYTFGTYSITMGGATVTPTISSDGMTMTIAISAVTGKVVISVATVNESTGEEDSGGTTWIDLPITSYSLGVTSTGTGRVSSNTTRFSTANPSTPNGILIPEGKTIYFKGLASGTYPLRFDYIYGTSNVVNPESGSTSAIEGLVGTASNYVAANYFPINTSGADTASVTNNFGGDYYFWFGFAGLNKTETIQTAFSTYNIQYYIA